MDIVLTPVEARVLGCLIEKEATTPDYYPLSLNALTTACNQKSNREPVMNLDERTVAQTLDSLSEKQLAQQKNPPESRTAKYGHRMPQVFDLSPQELGTLCVLLLRGPQTAGEIKGRATRLCTFDDLPHVQAVLHRLADREDGPFVVKLPRQPGRREHRYEHLLCGEIDVGEDAMSATEAVAAPMARAEEGRIAELERRVAALEARLDELTGESTEADRPADGHGSKDGEPDAEAEDETYPPTEGTGEAQEPPPTQF